MKGRPAIYATFSSYDEVAHHSGLERVRHARGAAQARPAVRPDRGGPRLRAAALRARRPLRPRPDAGLDVQAAQRLRARRARRALALARQRRGHVRRRRAELDGRPRARRGDRHGREEGEAEEERRLRPRRRRDGLGQPRSRLPDGGASPADARGDERAASRPDPGASQPSPRRLAARPLVRARACRARRRRHPLPRRRQGRGRGSARGVLAERAAAPPAHGRVHPRRRHHDRQLLRPGARDRLRVRGADLVPRRHRRPADAAVHPPSRASSPVPDGEIIGAAAVHEILARLEARAQRHGRGLRPTSRRVERYGHDDALGPSLRARDLVDLVREVIARYGRLGGSQFAAAISYRALFSLVPLATFVATILAQVLSASDANRQDLVSAITDQLDLTAGGRRPARLADRGRAVAVEPRRPRRARARALGCDRGDVVDAEDAGRRVRRGRRPQLRPRPARQRAARARRARR